VIVVRACFLGLLVASVAAAAASAEGWRTYVNPRFGAMAQYPADWTMGPEPENGDGRQFTSPDGRASLTISGILFVLSRAEEFAIRLKPDEGETIAYQQQGRDWIVVSGLKNGRIFYRKSLLTCDVWNDVSLDYPAADKVKYDAIVAHVAASLKGSRGLDSGPCK
jgi:serine/threonine-protein kinase